jgi:signal transduction histidine kinase
MEKDAVVDSTDVDKKYFFKSIRFKFICWFLAIALVPLLIVGTISYFYGKKIAIEKLFNHLVSENDLRKEHIKTFLSAKKGRTIDFSSDGFIRDITKKIVNGIEPSHSREKDIEKLNYHLIRNKVPLDEDIIEIFIVDLNGRVISSSNKELLDSDVSTFDYFQAGKKDVYISQIYNVPDIRIRDRQPAELTLSTNRDFMAVAAPLKEKSTLELIGVLVNKVDKCALDKILNKRNGLGETGEAYLVNKDKLIITKSRVNKNDVFTQKVDTIGVRECISGNDGIGTYNDYRDIPVIGSYAWLDEPGWALMLEMDVKEAFAPLKKILNLIIIIAIPMFSVIISVSFLVSRRVARPIISISDAIKKVTSGDRKQRDSVFTDDELGEISRELRRIEHEMEDSYEQLLHSERLASVGRIAAGVVHEINNPLSVLSGKLQLLIENCTDNIQLEEYEKLLHLSGRIEKTVDGLLSFSRQKDMELNNVNINTVIEDSISLVERQMTTRGIKIVKKYGVRLPLVKISVSQMQQVFLNIIMNAFDSMVDNGILTICTKISDDGENIHMVFEDTGSGVSSKNIDKIFEPFFTTKDPHKGTGLGLSISHGIVKNHKGKIKVESREGKGTIFTVSLPVNTRALIT